MKSYPRTSLTCLLVFTLVLLQSFTAASWTVNFGKMPQFNLAAPNQPSSSSSPPLSATAVQDIHTLYERRISTIVNGITNDGSVKKWLATLGQDGKWPDSEVDYTTQCAARRANWPAQTHWSRIVTMAAAYHGGTPRAAKWAGRDELRDAIGRAMAWWFERDFLNEDCEDAGGTDRCPCSDPPTPASWLFNTNWYSNIILIPHFVGQACLLLNSTLSETEYGNCTHITTRAYANFERVSPVYGANWLTGANTLDVASIGIDGGVVSNNVTQLSDAYRRIHLELSIVQSPAADGIRPDGSFGQHGGLLYNGNYGKDYANDVLALEFAAGGTEFEANATSKSAFATLIDGDRWMIFRNTLTQVLHWDFSVLPRFISFPVIDNQATANLKINLTDVKVLGELWSSETLLAFESDLNTNDSSTNAGRLEGNRMFYANDYMVQRGSNYVTTLKMYSTRTKNTECTNSQNPFGFHLSDGTVYTYVQGNEYEDIAAALDWNLIPGTTVDYGVTKLSCDSASFMGIESFVGGASDGQVGVAAMRYTNPSTRSFGFQKAWFFLEEDVQHVLVSNISSSSEAAVLSVLDQKRNIGEVHFDNSTAGWVSLWHGNVGYLVHNSLNSLAVNYAVAEKTGIWSSIGTSTQPPVTVDLFTAWIEHRVHNATLAYTTYPGADLQEFERKKQQLHVLTLRNDASVSAIYDQSHATAMLVFWDVSGGTVHFDSKEINKPFTITAKSSSVIIYKQWSGNVTVADPSQALASIQVSIAMKNSWPSQKTFHFELPRGGLAGQSVTQNIYSP